MKLRQYYRRASILLLTGLISYCSFAQCLPGTASIDLDTNNVKASLSVDGSFWQNGNKPGYVVPVSDNGLPEVAAISAGGLWMGGFDPAGNLQMAASTYGSGDNTDYWPGPMGTEADCENYNRFWSVTSEDIKKHIADFLDNGMIDDPIPFSILGWPGRGSLIFPAINGFELPDDPLGTRLAPFYDDNQNGLYEPVLGDYPDIRCADKGVWWTFNDFANPHAETQGAPLNFQINALAYSFISDKDIINNTTFYELTLVNRSDETIDSAYVGLWVDFDIGCGEDDFVGCDPEQRLVYAYNADAIDGDDNCGGCNGVNTYCEEIPIVGIRLGRGLLSLETNDLGQDTIVEKGMSNFMYYNNEAVPTTPSTPNFNSTSAVEAYRLLSGSWPDGTRLTKGGNGYNPGSTDYTNYAFPDAPDDPDGWSMCSANLQGGDRRALISSGPATILPSAINAFTFAVITVENVAHPCPDIQQLSDARTYIDNFYSDLLFTDCSSFSVATTELVGASTNIYLQPNPMTDQAQLVFEDLNDQVDAVSIFSVAGKQVREYSAVSGNSLTIERGSLSPGIYFYSARTNTSMIHSGKFVVK